MISADGTAVYPWAHGETLTAAALNAAIAQGGLGGGTLTGPLYYTATGAPTSVAAQNRGRSLMTVEDFGAVGDGVADDTAAFNAYATSLRNLTGYSSYKQFTLGHARVYRLLGSVNLTSLSNTIIEGNGSCIVAAPTTAGTVTLDAVQAQNTIFQNFTLIAESSNCKYGIQVGRAMLSGGSWFRLSSYAGFSNLHMDGTFGSACIYNRAVESSVFQNLWLQNRTNATAAYSLIMDGDASFPITSQFASTYNIDNPTVQDGIAPGTPISFNQQTVLSCNLNSTYGSALWTSNMRTHRYMSSYFWAGAGRPAVILSYAASSVIDDLWFDVHCEPNTISSVFSFTGAVASPTIRTLRFWDVYLEAANSVFALGTGVTSLTIHDLDLRIQHSLNANIPVFDNPANYTILGGHVYCGPSVTWNGAVNQGLVNANGSFQGNSLTVSTLNANSVSMGSDPAGAINLGNTTGTATTPYIHFYAAGTGAFSMRLICTANNSLLVRNTSNATVAQFTANGLDNCVIGSISPLAATFSQINVTTNSGPNIRSGTGAAAGTQPAGSLWLRTDGAAGSRIYVSAGGGTWAAIAGV